MTLVNRFDVVPRSYLPLVLASLAAWWMFGCAHEVLPIDAAGRECVSRKKTELAQCQRQAQRSQGDCVRQEREAARAPYEQALAQYQREREHADREHDRERRQQQIAYNKWKSDFEHCKREQRRAAQADRRLDENWAIAQYCDDTPPHLADFGPNPVARPKLEDVVDTRHCEQQHQSAEDNCARIYKTEFEACGGTFE